VTGNGSAAFTHASLLRRATWRAQLSSKHHAQRGKPTRSAIGQCKIRASECRRAAFCHIAPVLPSSAPHGPTTGRHPRWLGPRNRGGSGARIESCGSASAGDCNPVGLQTAFAPGAERGSRHANPTEPPTPGDSIDAQQRSPRSLLTTNARVLRSAKRRGSPRERPWLTCRISSGLGTPGVG
jgi:hypothetical protein